ncbi:hypothetical protein As57867_016840, partial [Aphanomyces stellatus]
MATNSSSAWSSSCASGINKTISPSSTNATCVFVKALTANVLSSPDILAQDCQSAPCQALLQTLYTNLYSYPTDTCSIKDSATGNTLAIRDLKGICIQSAPATSTPPGTLPPIPNIWTSAPDPSKTSSKGVTYGVVGGVVAVVVVSLVIWWCIRRKRQRELVNGYITTATPKSSGILNHGRRQSAPLGTQDSAGYDLDMSIFDAVFIPPSDVQLVKALATGAYGEVWIADLLGERIAAKRLLPNKLISTAEVNAFLMEIELLSKINSPYIVRFIGASWTRPADVILLTEFLDGGDLRSALESNETQQTLSWHAKLVCASHIALGLDYLHTAMTPKVIHRDLKSRNILLDKAMPGAAKITDFGIARETIDATLTPGVGTQRWMAPEVLNSGKYTEKADIFSFGVILTELEMEIVPYSDLR